MRNLNYTVRKARADDATGIGKVHYNAWIETYSGLLPPEMISSLSEQKSVALFKKEKCENMYVATVGDEVVAFCGYGAWRDPQRKEPLFSEGELVGLYVLKAFQRNGIGTALLQQVEGALRQKGFSIVSLWVLAANTKAQAFYKAMGFHDTAVKKQSGLLCELKESKVLGE